MTALRRDLSFWTATSIVVGCVIGSGVFVKPGKIILLVGNSNWALASWLFGGMITICGGLTIAEVAARIPRTGGVYTYIEEIYGSTLGYLCGWVQTVIYGPAIIAAISLYFGSVATSVSGIDKSYSTLIAISAMAILISVNIAGAKYGGMVQQFTTFVKLIPIFAIAIFGLLLGHEPIFGATSGSPPVGSVGGAVLSTLFAYDGWMLVGNVAGEMKNPARDLPRAIVLGLSVVVIAYLSVNIALFHTLTGIQIAQLGESAANEAATQLFGSWGGRMISIGILISIFGSLNGNTLGNTRVPFAMALRDELPFSKWIAYVHPTFRTPMVSILLQASIATLMILFSNPDFLTDMAIFSLYMFFALAFIGLFLLRRKNEATPPNMYRTPLYPFIPMIAIMGCIYILFNTVVDQPMMTLYSIGLTLSGLPLRYLRKRNKP